MCIEWYRDSLIGIGRVRAEIRSRYIGNRDRRGYTSGIVVYSRG